MARILEPWTSNSLNLSREWPKLRLEQGVGDCILRWHAHCNHRDRPTVAVGNRGNRQLALAWDDSLVTPLRSLGRPENVGARSSVLGFCRCCV